MALSCTWEIDDGPSAGFALLATLLIFTAAPIAWGWTSLLPDEGSPFERDDKDAGPDASSRHHSREPFAICLLALVTVSYVLKIPGMPIAEALQSLARAVPQDYFQWIVIGGRAFFVVTPGLAAAYGALRKGPLRVSLILGGILVVVLWLASPYLRSAIQS